MKRHPIRLLAGLLAIVGMFSCASYDSPPVYSPPAYSAPSDAAYSPAHSSRAPATEERPGLATGWGERKTSQVVDRSFVRASSKPAGTDVIFYNDPAGIKAMAGRPVRVEPLQRAAGSLVEWGVKGRRGYLPTYKEHGYGRRLVAGEKNANYAIVVRNRSRSTLEIVASVDGLDVMDGKAASFGKRGYLVEPGETIEIDGFRTSHHSVAAFRFSGVAGSYANLRHGDTRNVGVLGLAVFTQRGVDPWTWMPREIERRGRARAFAEAP